MYGTVMYCIFPYIYHKNQLMSVSIPYMDPMGYTVMADIMSNPPDLKRALGNCKGFCFWLESVESDVVSLVERHEAKMTPQKHGFSIPTKIP